MKRMITSVLAVLLLAGAAQAQDRAKGDRKEHHGELKELNLTAEQKTKLKDLHARQKAEMEAVRNNKSLTQEQRRSQAREIHEKYKAEQKALLTPEQQQKAAQFRGDHKDHQGAGGPGGRDTLHRRGGPMVGPGGKGQHGGRMEKMQEELNLSADQQAKVQAIREQNRGKLEAIRSNTALTQDQKRQQAREIMKSQMDQMKGVLTPEQQQKLQEKRKGRKDAAR